MESLNEFEKEVLNRLSDEYEILKEHIPFLIVKNREYTGVGMYVNFSYSKEIERFDIGQASLGTSENINIKGLKYGLVYELDISDGKINFIEFVTCGEAWDGNIEEFSF